MMLVGKLTTPQLSPRCAACFPAQLSSLATNVQQQRWQARQRVARHRCMRMSSTTGTESQNAASVQGAPVTSGEPDAYVAASLRLRGLIECLGEGEDELMDGILAEEPAASKLQVQLAVAALITTVSVFLATLAGQDPWGGASFSLDSLQAVGMGLGLATPLVALRAWSWTPQASQQALSQLADARLTQLEEVAPWFANLKGWHVAMLMALEVVPATLLLFPATQGCLLGSLDLYARLSSGYQLGDDLPMLSNQPLVQLGCLSLTTGIAALGKGLELTVTEQEFNVVTAAVENADRYYRVMATGVYRRAADAEYAARAFRAVAQAWFEMRAEACVAAASVCALDVMALGGMWYGTHSLLAPAAAALAINSVDYFNFHAIIRQREMKAQAAATKKQPSGKGGGANGGSSSSNSSSNTARSPRE
mmetsp:Transcript_8382/g.22378  ORF Transcript_8382/g.22378 Transcript_8382/m.22378 type:complete len:422 (+) Transcript_8382:46-1311(+)